MGDTRWIFVSSHVDADGFLIEIRYLHVLCFFVYQTLPKWNLTSDFNLTKRPMNVVSVGQLRGRENFTRRVSPLLTGMECMQVQARVGVN